MGKFYIVTLDNNDTPHYFITWEKAYEFIKKRASFLQLLVNDGAKYDNSRWYFPTIGAITEKQFEDGGI